LAELVRFERYRHRWSQDELAAKAGVSRDTVSAIENGRVRLSGRAVGKVLQSLEIAERRLGEIYGDALRGTLYEDCLVLGARPGGGLSAYIDHLRSLSDDELLEAVGHDARPSHRVAYLDAIERRWHAYEAFATNRLPWQFRDEAAIEAAADSMIRDDGDREAYVGLQWAYRDQRWAWLGEHPSRRRHQVVISASGLTEELRALSDERRAAQLIGGLSDAVVSCQGTFALLVADTGSAALPELEVVSQRVLDLAGTRPAASGGRCSVAIRHLRHEPGRVEGDYDLAVHFDPPFVDRFFRAIRGFWFSALGQYQILDPAAGVDGRGGAVADLTVARLRDCLNLAYS
jgi:transcriptional regulator with XRE-family HTH domain